MKTADIKAMIGKIQSDTGVLIVKADQEGEPPEHPYAVYKVTSPYIKGRGRGNLSIGADGAGNAFESLSEQPLCTLSFNLFADDVDEARELAIQFRNWFTFAGEIYLQDNGIAVRNAGNIQNRTTFLVNHYEYKHGFDVQLRKEITQTRMIDEAIENINMNIGG